MLLIALLRSSCRTGGRCSSDPGRHRRRAVQGLKFRTMGVDAEARLADLQEQNERNGPLFKLATDPRVTWVGASCERPASTMLHQLRRRHQPRGSPAGPAGRGRRKFDEELRDGTKVVPGMTGLWQVKARDNPSFSAYRRAQDLLRGELRGVASNAVILFRPPWSTSPITAFVTALFGAALDEPGRRRGCGRRGSVILPTTALPCPSGSSHQHQQPHLQRRQVDLLSCRAWPRRGPGGAGRMRVAQHNSIHPHDLTRQHIAVPRPAALADPPSVSHDQ